MNDLVKCETKSGYKLAYFYEDFKNGENPLDRINRHFRKFDPSKYKVYPVCAKSRDAAIKEVSQ